MGKKPTTTTNKDSKRTRLKRSPPSQEIKGEKPLNKEIGIKLKITVRRGVSSKKD